MLPERQLLFNHIPKTGGITMRIILKRVYGQENIFTIDSRDIGGSLEAFRKLTKAERAGYSVISGHGAEMFRDLLDRPFRLTILREPVTLFLSQYHYLKTKPGTDFYPDVSRMDLLEEYMDYALKNGQDNLLTRYLSDSMQFLIEPGTAVPDLQRDGETLLERAMENLNRYDAVIDLARFDDGIFDLSRLLEWKKVPIYRPSNRNRYDTSPELSRKDTLDALRHILRFDIKLYDAFRQADQAQSAQTKRPVARITAFRLRQKGIAWVARALGKF